MVFKIPYSTRLATLVPRGLLRFLSVGVAGLATQTTSFTVLYDFGFGKSASWWLALALATLVTWQLNRLFTFDASGHTPLAELLRYVFVAAIAQGISFGAFLAVGSLFPRLPAILAVVVGAVIATGFSYTGQRFFTFRSRRKEIALSRVHAI